MRRFAPWIALALFAVISGAARIWVNQKIEAPYILTDELQYSAAAERLAESGELPTTAWSFLYPILIAPGWFFESTLSSYEIAKAINVVVMTSVVIPVFLWARRLMKPTYAVATAAVVLMMPSLVYTGTLMTENAFLPVFVASLFAFALAVERPTGANQLMALAFIALAFSVRQQGVVLVPMLIGAVMLKGIFDVRATRSARRLGSLLSEMRRYWVIWAGLSLAILAYVVYTGVRGESLGSGLGAYSAAAAADYSVWDAGRWIVFHFGELTLTSAALPTMAFVVVLWQIWARSGAARPAERAFVAVALPAFVLLLIQVGAFASRWALRIEERNLFYIVPVLIIALALWIERGMPRPTRATAVGSAVVAVAIFLPPYGELLNSGLVNDTLGLLPMLDAVIKLEGGLNDLRILMAAGVVVAAWLFAVAPRKVAVVAIPGVVATFLLWSSFGVFEDVRRAGLGYRFAPGVGVDANWIDRAVGSDADVLFIGLPTGGFSDTQKIRWQTDFFNRSVDRTVVLDVNASVDPATGFFVAGSPPERLTERYLLTDGGLSLRGRPLIERPPLTLYELDEPVRIQSQVTGMFGDGWTGQAASIHLYRGADESATELDVAVGLTGWSGPDVPATVTIRIGTLEVGEDGAPRVGRLIREDVVELHAGDHRSVTIVAPAESLRVEILVDRTFSPADFGLGDARQLGVQLSYVLR